MPVFSLNNTTVVPPVVPSINIDEDGDVELSLDGVKILWLSRVTGRINRYCLLNDDRVSLTAKGISFSINVVAMSGEK